MLSEVIVAASQDPELLNLAKAKGAQGINLAGLCCTGNEVLMRKGIPRWAKYQVALHENDWKRVADDAASPEESGDV